MQLPPEGRVFVAVSGGVDSMVLLEALARVASAPAERTRLAVLHVNHALRGDESDGDEVLVRKRARELGIEARVHRLSWTSAPSQDDCRRARDAIFRGACSESGDRVWLAHHLNDQAETVFFRLLRGTGARGLRGMLPANGIKVRPLLGIEKADLVLASRAWRVPWREDRTNLDAQAYERNWLRGFFPELEARRPGFQRKLAALAEEAQGWRFQPEAPLDLYEASAGVTFGRWSGGAPSAGRLAETFHLSRRHATDLARLVCGNGGRLEASGGAKFTWSAGVLLSLRGTEFRAELSGRGPFVSPLGAWRIPRGARLLEAGGERRKKEFQALRVPVFFRDAIPVLDHGGKPLALLPGRAPLADFRFEPSPLARWWLAPSGI